LFAPVILAQEPPQTQVPGAIRSRVVLVPVDVRAIDGNGDPVTDLRQPDFTIEENGVAQTIAHFSTQTYTPQAPAVPSAPTLRRGPGLETSPLTHRTFAVLLGRGRLQGPSKGLDAVIDFIRTGLLPQDRIAVLAYGRATDLTTDRDSIVRLLERYRERHTHIEALLDQYFDPGGLAWLYRTDHPPHMKPAIDTLFSAPGLPAVRQVAALEPPGVGEFERDRLRILDGFDRDDRDPGAGYIFNQSAREDLEKLHGAVEYLRYLEGEKHLVFVTEDGMHGVTRDQWDRLAAVASDARVTISPVHTAGVALSWSGDPRRGPLMGISASRPGTGTLMGPSWQQRWANADLRAMASLTGGQVSIYKYASRAFDRLDRATRFHYVLGYYPANATWDGSDRRIKVSVRRPGVTVLHRHSYYAREDLVPYDRREFLTHSRIASAGAYRLPVSDVSVTLSASSVEKRQNQWQASVKVMVDPATIAFSEADGRHVASLDIAVFVGGRNQRQVGEVRKRVDLNLLPESYARLRQDGVSFSATIDLTAPARYVKAVVYDYAADRLGSAVTELR
jgi:VWFA-related protein